MNSGISFKTARTAFRRFRVSSREASGALLKFNLKFALVETGEKFGLKEREGPHPSKESCRG